jgi:hypothetical protein
MHVLRGLLCANETRLPELRRRIAAAAETDGAAGVRVKLRTCCKGLLTNYAS